MSRRDAKRAVERRTPAWTAYAGLVAGACAAIATLLAIAITSTHWTPPGWVAMTVLAALLLGVVAAVPVSLVGLFSARRQEALVGLMLGAFALVAYIATFVLAP